MALSPHVRRGQTLRIPHTDYNAFLDAAERSKRSRSGQGGGAPADVHQPGLILVRNTHNDVLPQFGAVGLEAPSILPAINPSEFKQRVIFNCSLPAVDSVGKFAILREPLLPGAIGLAVASGVTPALFVLTDDTAEFCDVTAGSTALVNSGTGTAQILYNPGVTQEPTLGVVRLWGKSASSASRRAAYFFNPVMIRQSAGSPAVTFNEVRGNSGVRFTDYHGAVVVDGQQAGDVEYLATVAVTDPANEWDDPIIEFLQDGYYRIDVYWDVRSNAVARWTSDADFPYTELLTTGVTDSHTHSYKGYEELYGRAQLYTKIRDSGELTWSNSFDELRLKSSLWQPTHSDHKMPATTFGFFNIPAGAELTMEANKAGPLSATEWGYLVEELTLAIERVGDYQPSTDARDLVGPPDDGEVLPAAGAHTTS